MLPAKDLRYCSRRHPRPNPASIRTKHIKFNVVNVLVIQTVGDTVVLNLESPGFGMLLYPLRCESYSTTLNILALKSAKPIEMFGFESELIASSIGYCPWINGCRRAGWAGAECVLRCPQEKPGASLIHQLHETAYRWVPWGICNVIILT